MPLNHPKVKKVTNSEQDAAEFKPARKKPDVVEISHPAVGDAKHHHGLELFRHDSLTTIGAQVRSWKLKNCGKIDPQFLRPGEIHDLRADTTLAREELGWQPTVDFKGLVRMMVEADLAGAHKRHAASTPKAASSRA